MKHPESCTASTITKMIPIIQIIEAMKVRAYRLPHPGFLQSTIVRKNTDFQGNVKGKHIHSAVDYLLTLLQLPLVEDGNATRAYSYSTASYP